MKSSIAASVLGSVTHFWLDVERSKVSEREPRCAVSVRSTARVGRCSLFGDHITCFLRFRSSLSSPNARHYLRYTRSRRRQGSISRLRQQRTLELHLKVYEQKRSRSHNIDLLRAMI